MQMISYEIRESKRARTVRILVYPNGSVVVIKPVRVSLRTAERFVHSRRVWIEEAAEHMRLRTLRLAKNSKTALPRFRRGTKAYKEALVQARVLVKERVAYFARQYGFSYGTITIRNQKTRWGSCTKAGNLSFNYRLAFLPPKLVDYVVVHELCHTREHNHSERFWVLVAKAFPDYKMLRKQLRSSYSF